MLNAKERKVITIDLMAKAIVSNEDVWMVIEKAIVKDEKEIGRSRPYDEMVTAKQKKVVSIWNE